MTYATFLLLFIIPLVVVGLICLQKSTYSEKTSFKQAMCLLMGIAFVYTTPWDNYLVKTQVWNYEDHRILFKIGYVPFEEYCFFILQTIMTSCWCLYVFNRNLLLKNESSSNVKHVITILLVGLVALSVYLLDQMHTRYLGLILVWSIPVMILQWTIGGQHLIRNLKVYLSCLLVPTVYLWIVDGYAIHENIWGISEAQTIGLKFFSLPFEEAVFFLVTNVMLIQGLILYIVLKNDFVKMLKRLRT